MFFKRSKALIALLVCLTMINSSMSFFDIQGRDDMSMIKWRPFADLEDFFEFRPVNGKQFDVDMYEDNGNVIVKMHVPGIEAEDISVKVQEGYIHISGERKEEKELKDKDYYHKEISQGNFSRVLPLPSAVDEGGVTAQLANGVLMVTLPKIDSREEEAKTIKVVRK